MSCGTTARVDPDAELVKRAIEREPEAVRQLVKSLSPVVHGRIAKALMRRRGPAGQRRDVAQEVEDLAQEVFLALFDHGGRALRAWDPQRGPLGAFVALITDHQVFSIFRSGKRRPWTDDIDILTAPDTPASEAHNPETRTASKQALDSLLDRLRADLSVRGFELFTRLFVEEQSVEVVSAELGMSADAIYAWRSRLSKVVKAMAAQGTSDEMSEAASPTRTSPLEQSP
jgi:RNA polymerase sigma factor (sigma-70 family)